MWLVSRLWAVSSETAAKSPLYNPTIDPRELAVTLDYVRRALEPDTGSRATAGHSKFY